VSHRSTIHVERPMGLDYGQVKGTNRRSARPIDKIKGYTGLSEFQHQVLCRKDLPVRH
jgi:hypothetical protein